MGKKKDKKLEHMINDPVHKHEGVWYFWNETWDKRIGSYLNKVAAEEGLKIYTQELNEELESEKNYILKDKLIALADAEESETKDEWDEPYP